MVIMWLLKKLFGNWPSIDIIKKKKKLACAWRISTKVQNVIWWSKTWDSMWWSYGGFRFILASILSRCDAYYKQMFGLALLIFYYFFLFFFQFLHWPCNKSNHSLCYFLYLFYVLFITIWFDLLEMIYEIEFVFMNLFSISSSFNFFIIQIWSLFF
jgi:hypothetical protein